jgi:hypothetical protein
MMSRKKERKEGRNKQTNTERDWYRLYKSLFLLCFSVIKGDEVFSYWFGIYPIFATDIASKPVYICKERRAKRWHEERFVWEKNLTYNVSGNYKVNYEGLPYISKNQIIVIT